MKILTNTSSSCGGIARTANEMVKYTNSRNGDIELLLLKFISNKSSVTKNNYVTEYNMTLPKNVTLENIYNNLETIDELYKRLEPLISDIKQIIDKEEPDVILSEGTYYAPWCLYNASMELDKPTIVLYAGILREEVKNYPEKMQKIFKEMEEDFYSSEVFYIFPSKLTKHKVEEEIFNRKFPNSIIIPNGISTEFFSQRANNNYDGIGFVGRYAHVKNPSFLIELSKELEYQQKYTKIYMVSEIRSSKLEKELKDSRINILFPMNTKQLKRFYRKRGVIISPSLFETYGNVPIESIATGTPALINYNMGVKDIFIELGLHNNIIDFDNISAVVDKIEHVQKKRISKDIIENLKANYSWSSIIKQYYDICENMISNNYKTDSFEEKI